jgi:ATP-dependent exoDNAse (exonuclease V) alpha subunit
MHAARDKGSPGILTQAEFSFPRFLTIGIGARVMFLKSYDNVLVSTGINSKQATSRRVLIANGSLGYVRDYARFEFCKSRAKSADLIGGSPQTDFAQENMPRILVVCLGVDEEICGVAGEETIRTQFPLCLAYALIIHKSQGKTLSFVHISAEAINFFVPALLYDAISRLTSG